MRSWEGDRRRQPEGRRGQDHDRANLGAALAELGRRVLLVDLDPQASLTISLGFDPDALEATVYTVLSAHADPKQK